MYVEYIKYLIINIVEGVESVEAFFTPFEKGWVLLRAYKKGAASSRRHAFLQL